MVKVEPWSPDVAELRGYEGGYESGEAETGFVAAMAGGGLVLRQRPDRIIRLEPLYRGAFSSAIGTVVFHRDEAGRVKAFSVSQDRVWDLRFTRQR
jgi:hypothetical protein